MQQTLSFSTLDFTGTRERLKRVVKHTPLTFNRNLSRKYDCQLYLKREDLQIVRSYKLRGAYNMMSLLTADQIKNGVVCASAGNHAQGFAYSCKKLQIKGQCLEHFFTGFSHLTSKILILCLFNKEVELASLLKFD